MSGFKIEQGARANTMKFFGLQQFSWKKAIWCSAGMSKQMHYFCRNFLIYAFKTLKLLYIHVSRKYQLQKQIYTTNYSLPWKSETSMRHVGSYTSKTYVVYCVIVPKLRLSAYGICLRYVVNLWQTAHQTKGFWKIKVNVFIRESNWNRAFLIGKLIRYTINDCYYQRHVN